MQSEEIYLAVENVTRRFGGFTAVDEVSFRARRGEFLCILGPSGCGKTTLLRMIAGLEKLNGGRVCIEGRDVSRLPVSKRNVGIVFQSYALFPNLTARQNIGYGLKSRGWQQDRIRQRVDELLDLVGLRGLGRQHPSRLSGGQQQRVALARALAVSPDLLLLDEPLSALDAKVRAMLRVEIRQLQQRLGVTTIMVTHDQDEALTMADRILVIDGGRLVQEGTPRQVYDQPGTPFVARFIGAMNFIGDACKVSEGIYRLGGTHLMVAPENGSRRLAPGTPVTIAIRPEDVILMPGAEAANVIDTRVVRMEYRGFQFRIDLKAPDTEAGVVLTADVPSEKVRRLNIREQMGLAVQLPMDRLRVYAGSGHCQ